MYCQRKKNWWNQINTILQQGDVVNIGPKLSTTKLMLKTAHISHFGSHGVTHILILGSKMGRKPQFEKVQYYEPNLVTISVLLTKLRSWWHRWSNSLMEWISKIRTAKLDFVNLSLTYLVIEIHLSPTSWPISILSIWAYKEIYLTIKNW